MRDYQTKQRELLEQSEGVIFPYSDRWVESHRRFAEKMWPNKLRRRDEAYNRWKFRGPQHGDVNGLLLAVVDGQVVGQLGLIPVKLWVNGEIYDAQWACDLMVDPGVRKMGLGSMLFAVAMARGWVTLGSEPSPLADITMTRIGFKPLVGPHKMVLPLDVRVLMGWILKERFKGLIPILSKILQPINRLRINTLVKKPIRDVHYAGWEDVLPLVAEQQSKLSKPHILHDKAYLAWRYNVPFDADIHTFQSSNGSYAICEGAGRDYYVYDWHTVNRSECIRLFTKILGEAIQAGCQNILAFANDDLERKRLMKVGFLKMRTPIRVIYHSVEPILDRFEKFHYCIYDSDGNL